MNIDNNDSIEIISLSKFINFYIENFLSLLIYTIAPFLLGVFLIVYSMPFIQDRTQFVALNVFIKDESFLDLRKSYLFSVVNIQEAVKRSGLSDRIKVDEDFIRGFQLINGHSELNILIEDYIKRDDSNLTKQLYFKPEQIDSLRKELVSQGTDFKVLYFKYDSLEITLEEVTLIFDNLIDIINERIRVDYDYTDIKLKEIEPLVLDSPISAMDVNKINNRLILIRSYISNLDGNFSSFAPEINLMVLLDELNVNEDLFNFLIQENPEYKKMIETNLGLDVEELDKRINALNDKLDIFFDNKNEANVVNSSQIQTLDADSTFIDAILQLSDSAKSVDIRNQILDEITNVETSKFILERRLDDLELDTTISFPFEQAEEYLVSSVNDTTEKINEYINIVKSTKKNSELISQLSYAESVQQSSNSVLIIYILYLLIGSLSFSFFIITLKLIRSN